MVLHNDKWKYKAKKNYERKHAIKAAKKNPPKATNAIENEEDRVNNEDETEASSEGLSDDEIGNDEKNKFKKGKKISNSWRFDDPVVDESILKDPEYIAQLNAIKQEEEDRSNYMKNTVASKLKEKDFNGGDVDVEFKVDPKISSLKKMKDEDLKNWKFDENENDVDHHDRNSGPEIRQFTDEERKKFLLLQEKIKHQREVEKLRDTMDKVNNKSSNNHGKVLELHSKSGADNYKGLVEKSLQKNQHVKHNVDIDELDDLVGELLGVDLKKDVAKKVETSKNVGNFDLDDLLKNSSKADSLTNPHTITNSSKPKASVVLEDQQELDDFLDSIL